MNRQALHEELQRRALSRTTQQLEDLRQQCVIA